MNLETQLEHATTLISLLHPAPNARALIEITSMLSKRKVNKSYYFYPQLAAEHAVEQTMKGMDAFVGLNPRSQMSGFERDVPYVMTIGLDLQPERTPIEEVKKRLTIGDILPTAWAQSGNGYHAYMCLSEPADPPRAKIVWERLCRFTGSDPVFNVNRIFRVPGTYNWKSNPPRPCFLVDMAGERRYTIDQIDAALDKLGAGPARPTKPGVRAPVDPPTNYQQLLDRLPEGVRYAILTGERNPLSEGQATRSEADWYVICALVRADATDDHIRWIYCHEPIGLLKYKDAGTRYLELTIVRARRSCATEVMHRRLRPSATRLDLGVRGLPGLPKLRR